MHDYEDIASLNISCWFGKKSLFKMKEKRLALIVPPSLPLQLQTLFCTEAEYRAQRDFVQFLCKM